MVAGFKKREFLKDYWICESRSAYLDFFKTWDVKVI